MRSLLHRGKFRHDYPEPGVTSSDGIVERWLDERLNLIALAVIAAPFVARVIVAARSYLNPD